MTAKSRILSGREGNPTYPYDESGIWRQDDENVTVIKAVTLISIVGNNSSWKFRATENSPQVSTRQEVEA
ncbi:hypothetical protein WA026_020602 [Henosepilachna vigintioctopunctata]|uniref:Uncharacterized protein n=1 Tax=Henosepilachna vigintioctopunctata TaxID=420089 RepID=A0AAW1V223_9CUCU